MSRIHAGKKSSTFVKPNTVTSCTVCSKTGKRARTSCTDTYTEYFLWLTIPGLCDEHGGSELKENVKTNNNNGEDNSSTEVIKNITQDIDVVDPQEVPPTNTNTNYNTNSTKPSNSNTNENKNENNNKTENIIENKITSNTTPNDITNTNDVKNTTNTLTNSTTNENINSTVNNTNTTNVVKEDNTTN